ncbi:hypothetical protein [Desulfoplanes formicivorans]|uniref:hypothetical protein n=1 Tax=Desulfoplanes formicivorans TaxID=1592317 RepID=UPI00114CAED7|nr:hypothetical protein [Desulfoplanes formicivorans]
MSSRQHPETRQTPAQPTSDHIELRSSGDTFADMDASQVKWDSADMNTTLDMIRSGAGMGIHGHLDPARVAGLLGDASMISV